MSRRPSYRACRDSSRRFRGKSERVAPRRISNEAQRGQGSGAPGVTVLAE
jgi:hypothetical protein